MFLRIGAEEGKIFYCRRYEERFNDPLIFHWQCANKAITSKKMPANGWVEKTSEGVQKQNFVYTDVIALLSFYFLVMLWRMKLISLMINGQSSNHF